MKYELYMLSIYWNTFVPPNIIIASLALVAASQKQSTGLFFNAPCSIPRLSISYKYKKAPVSGALLIGGEDDVKDELLISLRETFFDLFL